MDTVHTPQALAPTGTIGTWSPCSAAPTENASADATAEAGGFAPEPGAAAPVVVGTAAALAPERRSPTRLILGLASAVAVAGLAFAGGRLTAPAAVASAGGVTGTNGGTGTGGPGAGFGNGTGVPPANGAGPGAAGGAGLGGSLAVNGTVTAVTPTSITVTLASGATVQIPIDASTTFHNATSATSADVAAGDTVTVQAARGGGGTTGTATDITVTP